MICPNCQRQLIGWTDTTLGSYGNACLECRLFVWDDGGGVQSILLDLAPFPKAHRSIPAYRAAVGWVGP